VTPDLSAARVPEAGTPAAREKLDSNARLTLLLAVLINMLDGLDIMIVAYVAPSVSRDFQLDPRQLGMVLSAGLVGMMAGGLLLTPLGDRFGRRMLSLLSLGLMTLGTLVTALSVDPVTFGIGRAIAGLGIGAILSTVATLVSEVVPVDRRPWAMGLSLGGYTFGAMLTGLVGSVIIPIYGWQRMLQAAALLNVVMFGVTYFLLPESRSFAARMLSIAEGRSAPVTAFFSAVPALFRDGRWRSTLLIWLAIFFGMQSVYFATNWIPQLVSYISKNPSLPFVAGMLYSAGGLTGQLLYGGLGKRFSVRTLLIVLMPMAGVMLVVFGRSETVVGIMAAIFFLGVILQGGFTGFYVIAAEIYSTDMRSAGLGWAIGIGRGGGILGPLVAGFLISAGMSTAGLAAVFAVPLVIAGVLGWSIRTVTDCQ